MPSGTELPIYVLSEEDDDVTLKQSFEAGASDFLLKPVNLAIFRHRMRRDLDAASRIGTGFNALERAHAESEFFRAIPEPAVLVGQKGVIVMVNGAFERVFARRGTVVGTRVRELLGGTDDSAFEDDRSVFADLICRSRGRVPVRVAKVSIENGPWRGSSVFMVSERSSSESHAAAAAMAPRKAAVLVLEDYDVVARSMRRLLEKAGHRVSVAASAAEAVEQFNGALERNEGFDVAILDLAIPGSEGGVDVIKSLRSRVPNLPAVVTSGAWTDPAMRRPEDFGFNAALKKPFSRDELLGVIAKVLSGQKK
ncbi:MAG TPA: response regulator [Opitutales bacterium]|nr:response regulator [Opitutales bacterium]